MLEKMSSDGSCSGDECPEVTSSPSADKKSRKVPAGKGTTTNFLHSLPEDVRKAVSSTTETKAAWKDITVLAKNEWICWVSSTKNPETRKKRLDRMVDQLKEGKRRPCCWPGCPHRRPSAAKYFK